MTPLVLGLFHSRFAGDDSLMQLARRRFQQAGLSAEMNAQSAGELEWLLTFRPFAERPVFVHLPRSIDLLADTGRGLVLDFIRRFDGRVAGWVVHDQAELAAFFEDYLRAVRSLDTVLRRLPGKPILFIENAAGLEPGDFAAFHRSIRDLERVSICVDVGHLGLGQTRRTYAGNHPGQDVCALAPDGPGLSARFADVERAVRSALPAVLAFLHALDPIGKPVHFHLHDGHPLARTSEFHLSDHLSFLTEVPVGDAAAGQRLLPPMFGPAGLQKLVATILGRARGGPVSFTLEIHPVPARLPLGDAASLFAHWRDKTNAEKMNHWLSVLVDNSRLLQEALEHSRAVS